MANAITRTFDANGNLTNETQNGVSTTYAYDSAGNLTSKTDANGGVTSYATYVAGLPSIVTDPIGNKTTYAIANNGTISSVTDPLGNATKYTYDPMYRVTGVTPPINAATNISWTDNTTGTIMTMTRGTHVTTTQYNSLGKPVATINTDGKISNAVYKSYDALDRLAGQSYPVVTGTQNAPGISYTYDALGRMLSATAVGQYAKKISYQGASNSETITDPNGQVTTETFRSVTPTLNN